MPSKVDKYTINNPKLDRRVKLTNEQRKQIKKEHEQGASMRSLARKYNVSRRLIDFIVHPERLEKNRKQFKERRKDGRYYYREKHTQAMRDHRKYKQKLLKKGELKQ